MKRLRVPKLKDGELKIYWGRGSRHDAPDVMIAWQGDSAMKRDSNLLFFHLCHKHPDPHTKPIFSKMNPSLIEELEKRGYDISTLKFSIMKKAAQEKKE